jgi:hypothetical protein
LGYDRIIEWVADHFDASQYSSYVDFEDAVKKRFAQDGVDFPDGAVAWLQEAFEDQFKQPEHQPIFGPSLDEYISPIPKDMSVELTPAQLFEPVSFDLGESQVQVIEPVQPSLQPEPIFSFKGIGKAFKSVFKRLFKLD